MSHTVVMPAENWERVIAVGDKMAAAIARVRALHNPRLIEGERECRHCYLAYPCPTIRALEGEA